MSSETKPVADTARHEASIAGSVDNPPATWTAALALCLRRYGAPETAALHVFRKDAALAGFENLQVDLGFDDTLTSAQWTERVASIPVRQRQDSEASPSPIAGWRVALVLGTEHSAVHEETLAAFDQVFTISEPGDRCVLTAFRRASAPDDWPLEQMLAHWERLAQSMCANAAEKIGLLPVLTDAETEAFINAYEKPVPDPENPRFGFEKFDDQVARTPDAPAVTFGEETITYRELWQRSNRMAQYLQSLGVGPETIVGVFLERSIDLVVAVLGLQKAGGGFFPIDPGYPPGRLEFLLTDSRAGFVITNREQAAKLPAGDYRAVLIDEEAHNIAAMSAEIPSHGLKPGNMAFVFYTSGSTGQPKGVIMPHRPTAAFDPANRKPDDLGVGEKVLLKSAVGFTLILREILWPLQSGGHLVVVPQGMDRDSGYMIRMLRDEHVVGANFVPSMLSLLVDEPEFAECKDLRLIYTVGESLAVEIQKRLFERLPDVNLFVFYGCTEAPSATYRKIRADDPYGDRIVIGKPMTRRKIYLLDRNGVPVPPGVPGEIHTGGEISRGYLNQPELTAQRFIPNPFATDPEERMYRTGDLGRWLPDGNLEYLGRTDFQVQIGGVRIELGEIEAALRKHPGVHDAAVIASKSSDGAKSLIGYIIPTPGQEPKTADLRSHLGRMLPEYMVPPVFVSMTEWPLLPNGKMDRRALPAPASATVSTRPRVEPRTEEESRMAALWCRVLGRETIGIDENFFDLGGHSLLAMRLVQEIRREFDRQIPLATLFAAPTVEKLTPHLLRPEAAQLHQAGAMRGSGTGVPLFHMPGLGGFGFVPLAVAKQFEGDRRYFDGLQHRGLDGEEEPLDRVEDIADYLVPQIRAVCPYGPYALTGYCFGGFVAYEVAQRLVAAGEQVTGVVIWDGVLVDSWMRASASAALATFSQLWQQADRAGRIRLLRRCARKMVPFLARRRRTGPNVGNRPQPEIAKKMLEAEYRAARAYRPAPYEGRVLLLRARREQNRRIAHVRKPLDGWDDLARGVVEVENFDCGHLEILEEPFLSAAARRMAAFLREGDATVSTPEGVSRHGFPTTSPQRPNARRRGLPAA